MKKSIFIIVALVFTIILIGAGCNKKEDARKEITAPTQEVQEELEELQDEYFIDFDISLENREITLDGSTNIPNGSQLSIGINRYVEYFDEAMNEPLLGKRVVGIVDAKVKVQDGKFSYSVYLTDKKWYEKDLAENKAIGLKLSKIYKDCYMSLTFTPARNLQLESVYKVLGNKFEKMKGGQVEESSSVGNVIQLRKDFELPVEEGIATQ